MFFLKHKYLLICFAFIIGYYFFKKPIKTIPRALSKRRIWYNFHVKRGMNKKEAWRKSFYYANKKNFNRYRFQVVPKNLKR